MSRDCVGIHTHADLSEMAREARESGSRDPRLTAAQRRRIPSRLYALPKRRALPMPDAKHTRNAAARLAQMHRRGTITEAEFRSALRRVRSRERHFGIRPSTHTTLSRDPDDRVRLYVEHVPLDSGGYQRSGYHKGRYWGTGEKLYLVSDDEGDVHEYVRAPNAREARAKVAHQKGIRARARDRSYRRR